MKVAQDEPVGGGTEDGGEDYEGSLGREGEVWFEKRGDPCCHGKFAAQGLTYIEGIFLFLPPRTDFGGGGARKESS